MPGFPAWYCRTSCVNALDTKTSITKFLLCDFGIKVFDAITSANTAAAHLVLLFYLRPYFRISFNAFQVSKPRKKQVWKLSLKTGFHYFLSFPHAQGFVPRRQNRMYKRDKFDNLKRNLILRPVCKHSLCARRAQSHESSLTAARCT